MTRERMAVTVRGTVQGVGFRPFVYRLAGRHRLSGWVRNSTGPVEMEVEGEAAELRQFLVELREQAPPLARIESLEAVAVPAPPRAGFPDRGVAGAGGGFPIHRAGRGYL